MHCILSQANFPCKQSKTIHVRDSDSLLFSLCQSVSVLGFSVSFDTRETETSSGGRVGEALAGEATLRATIDGFNSTEAAFLTGDGNIVGWNAEGNLEGHAGSLVSGPELIRELWSFVLWRISHPISNGFLL